jgi:hypothetical protein
MPPGVFLSALGTDARNWAAAFTQLNGDKPIDEGLMLAWFANAIMAGYDAKR